MNMGGTGTKHLVRHRRKSVLQWSVISKFTCIVHTWENIDVENILDTCTMNDTYNDCSGRDSKHRMTSSKVIMVT